jgi:membrane protein required for colicin V production
VNGLDILFLIILTVVIIRGLFRGMVKELASIVGVIVSFFLANKYHPLLLPYLEQVMTLNQYARICSYALVFIACFLLIFLVSLLIRKFLKLVMLSWVDCLAGGGFGLIKGALICSLILFVLTTFLRPGTSLLTTSQLAPHVNKFTKTLGLMLPEDIQGEFDSKRKQLENLWQKKLSHKEHKAQNT